VCVRVCVCVCVVVTTARPAQDVDRGPTMARVILTQTLSSRDQTGLETTVSVSVSVLVSRVLASVSRLCLQLRSPGSISGPECWPRSPGARFTKYLTTILRLSYDNVKVTIDLRRMSNLQKHPTKGARFFLGTIHLQTYKIVRDSVRKLAYDIPKRNFSTF